MIWLFVFGYGIMLYFFKKPILRLIAVMKTKRATAGAASVGRVYIKGTVIAEKGVLESPGSGIKCVLYWIDFLVQVITSNDGVKRRRWDSMGIERGGLDFVLQDDTGKIEVAVEGFDLSEFHQGPELKSQRSSKFKEFRNEYTKQQRFKHRMKKEKLVKVEEMLLCERDEIYVYGIVVEEKGKKILKASKEGLLITTSSKKSLLESLRFDLYLLCIPLAGIIILNFLMMK